MKKIAFKKTDFYIISNYLMLMIGAIRILKENNQDILLNNTQISPLEQ